MVLWLHAPTKCALCESLRLWGTEQRVSDIRHYLEQTRNTPWIMVLDDYSDEEDIPVEALRANFVPHYNGAVILVKGMRQVVQNSDEEVIFSGYASPVGTYIADETGWGRCILKWLNNNEKLAMILHHAGQSLGLDGYGLYSLLGSPASDGTGPEPYATCLNLVIRRLLGPEKFDSLLTRCVFPRLLVRTVSETLPNFVNRLEHLLESPALNAAWTEVPKGLYIAAQDFIQDRHVQAAISTAARYPQYQGVAQHVGIRGRSFDVLLHESFTVGPPVSPQIVPLPFSQAVQYASECSDEEFGRYHGALIAAYEREAADTKDEGMALGLHDSCIALCRAEFPPYHYGILRAESGLLLALCRLGIRTDIVTLQESAARVRESLRLVEGVSGPGISAAVFEALTALRAYGESMGTRTSDAYELGILYRSEITTVQQQLTAELEKAESDSIATKLSKRNARRLDSRWALNHVGAFLGHIKEGRTAEAVEMLTVSEGVLAYLGTSGACRKTDAIVCNGRDTARIAESLCPRDWKEHSSLHLGIVVTFGLLEVVRHHASKVKYEYPLNMLLQHADMHTTEGALALLRAFHAAGVGANSSSPHDSCTAWEVTCPSPELRSLFLELYGRPAKYDEKLRCILHSVPKLNRTLLEMVPTVSFEEFRGKQIVV